MARPIGFFVHHQGRGHAARCSAIIDKLDDRPITILTADRGLFGPMDDRVSFIDLPNAIGDPSLTSALHGQQTPDAMQCVPLGSDALRENARMLSAWLTGSGAGLFINDVSVEWALLARLCSVPCVKIRMHGERDDPSHVAAYQASAGIIAPYAEMLEQPDYPDWAQRKTFYSGGLCTTTAPVPERAAARTKLGLDTGAQIIVALSGGGGGGANYASLTMAARALPEAMFLSIGQAYKEGHETEFHNLRDMGWVDNVVDYLAAADVIVASAGDNTVHEIARVKRPFLCIPEWRYYNEQVVKAAQLARLGAAHVLPTWPASNGAWRDAIGATLTTGTARLEPLFDGDAASKIARHLIDLDRRLWEPAEMEPLAESHVAIAKSGLTLVG